MICFTKGEFTDRTGIDLDTEAREMGVTADRMGDILLDTYKKYVYKTARRMPNCIDREDLTITQIEAIKEAICVYGKFCLLNGEWETLHNGNDPTPEIITILRNGGVIHNGFKGR